MSKRKQEYPCLKCNVHVKKNDHALQCALCDHWVHLGCIVPAMSMDTFNVLVAQVKQNGGTFWACISCRSFKAKIDKRLTLLEKWSEGIDVDVKDNAKRIGKMEKELKEVKTNVSTTKPAEVQTIKDDTSDAVFSELNEREKRKRNLIVHGVQEAGNEVKDGKLQRSHDLQKLEDLANALDVVIEVSTSLKSVKRLGKKSENPRPLLLSFNTVKEKESMLDSASKLKDQEDWNSVSLVQDLTKKQRQQEQSLREKRDKMNAERSEEDEKNWEWKLVGRRGERYMVKSNKGAVSAVTEE